jgi:hypothetical protein
MWSSFLLTYIFLWARKSLCQPIIPVVKSSYFINSRSSGKPNAIGINHCILKTNALDELKGFPVPFHDTFKRYIPFTRKSILQFKFQFLLLALHEQDKIIFRIYPLFLFRWVSLYFFYFNFIKLLFLFDSIDLSLD